MKSTVIHPILGEITISRTRRARRITLSVRPSGEVRLSFPPYVSQRRALEFLESKREWILRAKAKYAARESQPTLSAEDIERLRAEQKIKNDSLRNGWISKTIKGDAVWGNFHYQEKTILFDDFSGQYYGFFDHQKKVFKMMVLSDKIQFYDFNKIIEE